MKQSGCIENCIYCISVIVSYVMLCVSVMYNTRLNHIPIGLFFSFSGQTLVKLIVKHIICPQNSKAWLFYFGPILSSQVRQLHFITDKCRSEELRGGAFSIRHIKV